MPQPILIRARLNYSIFRFAKKSRVPAQYLYRYTNIDVKEVNNYKHELNKCGDLTPLLVYDFQHKGLQHFFVFKSKEIDWRVFFCLSYIFAIITLALIKVAFPLIMQNNYVKDLWSIFTMKTYLFVQNRGRMLIHVLHEIYLYSGVSKHRCYTYMSS